MGILLTNIGYAFTLFCRETMDTGDFVDGESWDSGFYLGPRPQARPTLFDTGINAEWAKVAGLPSEELPWMVVLLAAFADLVLRPKARNVERTKHVRDLMCEGDSAVTWTKLILSSQSSRISRLRATTSRLRA